MNQTLDIGTYCLSAGPAKRRYIRNQSRKRQQRILQRHPVQTLESIYELWIEHGSIIYHPIKPHRSVQDPSTWFTGSQPQTQDATLRQAPVVTTSAGREKQKTGKLQNHHRILAATAGKMTVRELQFTNDYSPIYRPQVAFNSRGLWVNGCYGRPTLNW